MTWRNTVRLEMRRHGARLVVAVLAGAATGLVVFSIAQVTGRNLFIIIGGLVGALAVMVPRIYGGAARLSEATVKVPQVGELKFVVNNDARQMAWHLFIETVTRVSTQPLAHHEGLLREALTSLYGLFATTRDTLKTGRPSKAVAGGHTVEYFAITMLNRELRPFLSTWHPRLRAYEQAHPKGPESAWPDNNKCRDALRSVQSDLHAYALGFARLAGVHDPEALLRSTEQ